MPIVCSTTLYANCWPHRHKMVTSISSLSLMTMLTKSPSTDHTTNYKLDGHSRPSSFWAELLTRQMVIILNHNGTPLVPNSNSSATTLSMPNGNLSSPTPASTPVSSITALNTYALVHNNNPYHTVYRPQQTGHATGNM